jgi:hypothetical protein
VFPENAPSLRFHVLNFPCLSLSLVRCSLLMHLLPINKAKLRSVSSALNDLKLLRVQSCVTDEKKLSGRQAGRQACRQAGRQASRQAGR